MSNNISDADVVGEFDYVIVGAGSAGCVLANRLSEDPSKRICLLEAGGPDKDPLIHAPLGFGFIPSWSPVNWRFETVPQKHLNGRQGFQPRGRVLGGSSSINAMIYIRGSKADYDGWAAGGAKGWDYDNVLAYFKKAEDNQRGPDSLHGTGGPLTVSELRFKNPLSKAFLEASQEIQLPANDDFNGAQQEGMGFYQVTQRNGRRCSTAVAYLNPARERQNLTIISGAQAERVTFNNKRATGVVFRQGKAQKAVKAAGEVVLSTGAFQSPQLLMLSGVGSAAHLQTHNINVVHDAPNVGQNLQDHFDYAMLRKSSSRDALGFTPSMFMQGIPSLLAYINRGEGPFTSNLAEAGGFLKTEPQEAEPDIQLHFIPGIVDDHGRKKHLGGGVTCHICVLRPKSRGSVTLDSKDPMAAPAIDPNFLDVQDDLHRTLKGAKIVNQIFGAPAMKNVLGAPLYINENPDDDALIDDIRNRGDTIYHPVGTCRMGGDDKAVVDEQLAVKGVEGLRVVDAYIMPSLVSGNTNAPTIMIAEKAADMIKQAAKTRAA